MTMHDLPDDIWCNVIDHAARQAVRDSYLTFECPLKAAVAITCALAVNKSTLRACKHIRIDLATYIKNKLSAEQLDSLNCLRPILQGQTSWNFLEARRALRSLNVNIRCKSKQHLRTAVLEHYRVRYSTQIPIECLYGCEYFGEHLADGNKWPWLRRLWHHWDPTARQLLNDAFDGRLCAPNSTALPALKAAFHNNEHGRRYARRLDRRFKKRYGTWPLYENRSYVGTY